MIFTAAADDEVESIVEKSFENVEQGDKQFIKLLHLYPSFSIFSHSFVSINVCVTTRLFAVILEHFDQVIGDCFMDCVNCLIRFANNKASDRISLKAIALLRICEDRLAEVCFQAKFSLKIQRFTLLS